MVAPVVVNEQYIMDRVIFDLETGCWHWKLYRNKQGYGSLSSVPSNWTGESRARRISYTIFKGKIPEGLHLLHSCDNKSCCNPDHLRPGTNAENMQDKVDRNKQARGTRQALAVLNEVLVLEIRERYSLGGISYAKLAKQYGVSTTAVQQIIERKTWKHV
jgi:hypothetical protein